MFSSCRVIAARIYDISAIWTNERPLLPIWAAGTCSMLTNWNYLFPHLPESGLLVEFIAGLLSKVPVQRRTEAEEEEGDEVHGCNGVVVPEEIGRIENGEEVVERDRCKTYTGVSPTEYRKGSKR